MKLDDIITTPYYTATLPSSGKKVQFRPIIVKEERALLAAFESEQPEVMMNTLVNVVKASIKDKVQLTPYDVEYMFLKIRAKSVGEFSQLIYHCTSCDHEQVVNINIEKAEILGKTGSESIVLSDTLTFIMKDPNIDDIIEVKEVAAERDAIIACIDKIVYGDEVLNVKDESPNSIIALIDRLTSEQFIKLKEFLERRPTLSLEQTWKCDKCKTDNLIVLRGLYDFF